MSPRRRALDPLIRAGVLVTAFLLVGCAPRWHRPGASEETFLIDRLECREEARVWQRRGDSFRETWRVDSNAFALCMTAGRPFQRSSRRRTSGGIATALA